MVVEQVLNYTKEYELTISGQAHKKDFRNQRCSLEKITGASRFFWHYIKEKITSRITVLVALQCKNNAKKLGRFINRFPF